MALYKVKLYFEQNVYVEADHGFEAKRKVADRVWEDENDAFVAQPVSAVQVERLPENEELFNL